MRRLYKQRIALLMLGLTLDAVALADGYVLDQALTKPVMSADGEVVEYAITFVLKDQRQRPISNMNYKIVLGTGQVVCGQRHAANHSMSGGKKIPVVMPQFPVVQEPAKYHIQFRALHNNTGRLVEGAPYFITLTDGQTFFGKTDAKGMTQLITLATAQDAQLEWLTHHEDTLSSEEQDIEGC